MELLTVGHGTLDQAVFVDLLTAAGVRLVVDVRRYPASRRNPQFGSEALATGLEAAGIAYRWAPELGGRRRGASGSPHVALRDRAFRAYADHMETSEFRTAFAGVLGDASSLRTAVLCAESLWWRCHRRLVADAVTLLHGVDVRHLMHDGRLDPHRLTDGVRRAGDTLVYDAGAPPLPLDAGP